MSLPELEDFPAGGPVAVFRLPIPMDGIQIINDAISRIYGEGAWTISTHTSNWQHDEPNSIQVNYPKNGGVGKRRTSRRLPNSDDTMMLRSTDITTDHLAMTVEDATEAYMNLIAGLAVLFESSGATNYLQHTLIDPATGAAWIVRLQKPEHPTPHDLLVAAHERYTALAVAVDAYLEFPNGSARAKLQAAREAGRS